MSYNPSLLPEEELRPWMECPDLDEKIKIARKTLNETLSNTSPTMRAGFLGLNGDIDGKSDALRVFEELVDRENWMYEDLVSERQPPPDVNESESAEFSSSSTVLTEEGIQSDPHLSRTIAEINQIMQERERERQSNCKPLNQSGYLDFSPALSLLPLSTVRRSPSGSPLKSVKYTPHRIFNSTATTAKATLKQLKPQKEIISLLSTDYANDGKGSTLSAEKLDQMEQSLHSHKETDTALQSSPSRPSIPSNNNQNERLLSSEGREREREREIERQIERDHGNDRRGDGGGSRLGGRARSAPLLLPVGPVDQSPSAATNGAGKAPPIGPLLSPISSDGHSVVSFASSGRRPSTSSSYGTSKKGKSNSKEKTVSEMRFEQAKASTLSSPLGQMTITSQTGSVASVEQVFGRAKLKKIRTLRDQLLTTAGGMGALARIDEDSGEGIVVSKIDKQAERRKDIELTKQMCAQTIEKNRVDSTWDILLTPGFLEQLGPGQVFLSDTHRNYRVTEEYDRAYKIGGDPNASPNKDELRIWYENAVKTGKKLFESGGGMKL